MCTRVKSSPSLGICTAIVLLGGCRSDKNSTDHAAAAVPDSTIITQVSCPICASAKLENKWCDKCKVGYVAGVPIKSKLLFEGLDAHGHVLVLSTFTCPTCKKAIAEDGFCDKCRNGFLNKLTYFSRLTYEMAHGKSVDIEKISCPICRKNAEHYGWCDKCNVGMVGNVVLKNRKNYDAALRPYEIMLIANEAGTRCEMCALAIITDTRCFVCKINYRDGKPQAPKSP